MLLLQRNACFETVGDLAFLVFSYVLAGTVRCKVYASFDEA